MNQAKRDRLRAAGWRVGSTAEFLGLDGAEAALIDIKLSLAEALRDLRTGHGLTQHQLARQVGSSQSRVAKMEAADPTVSLDLLVRTLLAAGATAREIGHVVARRAA